MTVKFDKINEELEWQQGAPCTQTDPELFYPDDTGAAREAKRLCATCDVRKKCLDYAQTNNEQFGVWGGMTTKERLEVRMGRSLPAASWMKKLGNKWLEDNEDRLVM